MRPKRKLKGTPDSRGRNKALRWIRKAGGKTDNYKPRGKRSDNV